MQSLTREEVYARHPELRELVGRLVSAYEPDYIFAFGSTSRGDRGPDSDFDLLVVVPDDAPEARRRSRTGYQALRGTGIAVDLVVTSRSRFESRVPLAASLPGVVSREGTLLHAA